MVKSKNTLSVASFDDITIVGLCTHLPDYQVAWYLNKQIGCNFLKYDDIMSEQGEEYSFYLSNDESDYNTFNLVALSNIETRWVVFSPPTDYLLIIRNYFDNEKFAHLVERLRAVPDIIAVYQIDLSRNKLLNSILEDIEMHEMLVLSKDMGE